MLKVAGNKVAVIPIYDSNKTASGLLYIPETAQERVDQGIVKYVGPKVKDIKIGAYVLFSAYSGTLLGLEGEGALIIIPEDFISAQIIDGVDTEIPGLYWKSKANGGDITARYEDVMNHIAQAFERADWHKGINVVTPRPALESYDKLRGG